MTVKRRGLGRNLDALLGGARTASVHSAVKLAEQDEAVAISDQPAVLTDAGKNELSHLPIDLITPGEYQPRRHFDEEPLQALAQSIRTQGVISPITVRKRPGQNTYELIAGERRWRAAQLAGIERIPALVKSLTDEDALAIGLIENLQREDLNPIEEAVALDRLLKEFELTHQQVADAVGKSRSAVSNLLRLNELNTTVKQWVESGDLEMGHARALLALDGGQTQIDAAKHIVANSLTVRETEKLIKQLLSPSKPVTQAQKMEVNTEKFVQKIAETLGAKVTLKQSDPNKGKLIIHYHSLAELDGIAAHIK